MFMPNRHARRNWGRQHAWWRIVLAVLDILAVLVGIGIIMVGFPNVWLLAFVATVAALNLVAAWMFGGRGEAASA
jgi:hypothetical protein